VSAHLRDSPIGGSLAGIARHTVTVVGNG
jgi:hypothetical protein